MLDVPAWVWAVTLVGIVAVLATDLALGARDPRPVTTRAAALGVSCYVGLAAAFAVGLLVVAGGGPAGQFVTGYLLEYSLSVDNLFVYLLLMSSLAVPEAQRRTVLVVGIVGTLLLRGPFIVGGAAAAERFSATFYVFGGLLVYTAIGLLRGGGEPEDPMDSAVVRLSRRVLPVADDYDGGRLVTTRDGRRQATPLLLAMVAVSAVGLVFALDSIPAIFGVTQDIYLIVTANAFALMGLRQLYFLLGGLLERLVYLSYGLAIVLGFIGVKLVLEALHVEGVGWAPQISTVVSLGVIVGVLAVTALASVVKVRRDPEAARSLPGG